MNTPRKIIVTGCSRGLGRALVDEFVHAGHHVAGCSRSAAVMAELAENYGDKHHFQALDVRQNDQVGQWINTVVQHMGVPDLVINNAAIINEPAPLWEVPAAEFQALMDINVVGVHLVTRHVLPLMIEQGSGVLVNLSSGWGRSVSAEVAPYCASKWAIEGMTQALAEELPAGLAAIPLSPGVIDTDLLRQIWGESAGGFRSAEQWARDAAPFILGLNSSNNGQSLTVPG